MKLNPNINPAEDKELLKMLVDHFNYSVRELGGIDDWQYLTQAEKEIVPFEAFEKYLVEE